MSFSDINCEDFEEKAKNEDKNDIFHNFHHAHRDPEGFLSHICQDGSSCDSHFKKDVSESYYIALNLICFIALNDIRGAFAKENVPNFGKSP